MSLLARTKKCSSANYITKGLPIFQLMKQDLVGFLTTKRMVVQKKGFHYLLERKTGLHGMVYNTIMGCCTGNGLFAWHVFSPAMSSIFFSNRPSCSS